nr:immunoglobulin light chain junction region [Macaca mulatta]
YQQYNSDPYNF